MNTIDEAAREAVDADLEILEALVEHAVAELTPRRGGSIWSRREARPRPPGDSLRASLVGADEFLAVGTIDDVVVGYTALRLESLQDGEKLAVVTDIYVLPDGRGVGVGEALLNRGIAWALAEGCIGVDSLALPGDRHTKNFFESFGLVARALTVHRALPGDE